MLKEVGLVPKEHKNCLEGASLATLGGKKMTRNNNNLLQKATKKKNPGIHNEAPKKRKKERVYN